MKHRITPSAVGVAVALLAVGLTASPAAQAQGRGRGRGQGQGQGQAGPDITFNRDPIAIRDPMRSAESDLIVRDDVQHELMLDGRQQEQVDDAIRKGQQEAMAKARAAMQALRQKMQTNGQNQNNGQNQSNMTPEDRQAAIQQVQQQMQDAMVPIRDEQDKVVEGALNKMQVTRLHQLDLQWRTALALNVPKLADQVNLTPEQRQMVASIYQEVTTVQQKAVQSVFGNPRPRSNNPNANGSQSDVNNGGTQNNSNGQDNGGQSNQSDQPGQTNRPNLDPQTLQDRIQQAQKSVNKARKDGAAKVLALLTPDERAQWNRMIGTRFTFQENTPIATDNP